MRYPCIIVILLLTVSATEAQPAPVIAVGARVRVLTTADTPPAGRRVPWRVGRIVAATPDSLTIETGKSATPLTLPASAVERLEVSRGRDRGKGMFVGALIGGLLAGGAAATASGGDEGVPAEEAVVGGAVAGLMLGGVMGALAAPERWQRAALPTRLGVAPRRGGGVTIRLRR